MSFFILLYICVIGALSFMMYLYFPLLFKQSYVKYIVISILSFLIWLTLYVLSFVATINPDYILVYSKFLYILTFIGACSMSGAFYFYGNKNSDIKKFNIQENIIVLFLVSILAISVGTDFFLKDVIFNEEDGVYVESFGFLFFLVQILYVLSPILSIYLSLKKYKVLQGINKKRFFYLTVGYHIFIFLLLIFLGILPGFNIWILQREQVLFFVPFLFGLWYPLYRYRFGNIHLGIIKLLIFAISAISTAFILLWSKKYLENLGSNLSEFWGISENVFHFEYIAGFIIFYAMYKCGVHRFLLSNQDTELQIDINTIKLKIPNFQNIKHLNLLLQGEFLNSLKIGGAKVISFEEEEKGNFSELSRFFQEHKNGSFLLHDEIFIEENIDRLSRLKIANELDTKVSLYLPLFGDEKKLIGILAVGHKYMKEYFSSAEIQVLIDLSHSIASHLKYLHIYRETQELNLTLDKRVDEKTIEYNNLISRQKEFIAYLGHEVKNPITNTLFLGKEIEDNLENLTENSSKKSIKHDIGMLNDELLKIADLTKNIFSAEKMDLGKITLYKSHIDIYDFLDNEVKIIEKTIPHIKFQFEGEHIGEISIDEIQFREVIHNLLTNASKYASSENGKVFVSLQKEGKKIKIIIEDNGKGLGDIHIENIFEKYATGNNDSVGLGMGLYLCKRIVELHRGTIQAVNSKKLGGASFIISLG